MAEQKVTETSVKRPKKPFKGAEDGKPFTPDNQPSPELKKQGWQELRAKRLLTQAILQHMTKGTNLEEYIRSLYTNAKKGNAKAIETINKGIEDDVLKIEHSGAKLNILIEPDGNSNEIEG